MIRPSSFTLELTSKRERETIRNDDDELEDLFELTSKGETYFFEIMIRYNTSRLLLRMPSASECVILCTYSDAIFAILADI